MSIDPVREKAALDVAAKEYEAFKFRLAAEQRAAGAPERAAAARERISAARGQRELEAAFAAAKRSLRR